MLIPVSTQVLSKTISVKRAPKIYRLPSIELTHTNINTWVNVWSQTFFLQALVFCPSFPIDPFLRLMLNVIALSYVVIQAKEAELVIILIDKNNNAVFWKQIYFEEMILGFAKNNTVSRERTLVHLYIALWTMDFSGSFSFLSPCVPDFDMRRNQEMIIVGNHTASAKCLTKATIF